MEKLLSELYPILTPKKTCVHLSPRLYLQRKGGGSKDHAPDHIQLKLKSMPDGMVRLLPQTMSLPLEQTPVTQSPQCYCPDKTDIALEQ